MLAINKSFFLCIPLLFLFFLRGEQKQFTIHGYAQGTDYTVKYFAKDSVVTKGSIDSILMVIDSSMSLYKSYSAICKFNASADGALLDPHFLTVIKKSFEISKATSGRFDITVAPLVQLWGFGAKPVNAFPDSGEVNAALSLVGMKHLNLKRNFLNKKKAGVKIDVNGIAQGYSVDVVAAFLEKRGVASYVVEIGGELRIKGPKPDGTDFKIGIEGPAQTSGGAAVMRHVIALNSGAITTSGNYRKFMERGAKKVTHLIDPKTGYPLDNSLISVTFYAKDAITADGYDNAIMAMEVEEALAFVDKKKNMEAYIIYHKKDGTVADTLTRGFRKMIVN